MSRRSAFLIGAFAVVGGVVSEMVRPIWLQPFWVPLTDFVVGQMLVWCGLIAAVARPRQSAGRWLVVAGYLWIIAAPRQWFSGQPTTDHFLQIDAISFTLVGWSDVVLAFIALTFAATWPKGPYKAMTVALIVVFAFQTVVRVLARADVLFGLPVPAAIYPLLALADIGRIVALVVAGFLIVRRWLKSTSTSRYFLGPVLAAGVATTFAPLYALWYPLSQLGYMHAIPDDVAVPGFWITNGLRVLVPVAMLFGILRQRRSRSAVADALAVVGEAPSTLELQQALSRALSDPLLRVATWDQESAAYVDEDRSPIELPAPGAPVTATAVYGVDNRPLAVLIHDKALDADPAMVAAGVAMTRLVTENERLSQDLRKQLDEVRASRARIVEAGDAERRRIERDLHDGVQQRLLALALALRRAGLASDDSAAADALKRGSDEALGVVADVRELAQGIHPAVLTEAGLGAALQGLADRSPVPVEVDVRVDGSASATATATAYYVASEALANVVKHAAASTAHVSAVERDGQIVVSVEDDGRGGADVTGSGLRGLGDRLAAIGGQLRVLDRPGGGTIVSASIPTS